MNTIQLECFLAVAETLNFSRAAELLNITQPAVSHQINSLENELNISLVFRTNKNVQLTDAGKSFVPDALKIIEISKSTAKRLHSQQFRQLKPFEICCHSQLETKILPEVLRQFTIEFPLTLPVLRFLPNMTLENFFDSASIQVMLGFQDISDRFDNRYQELCRCSVSCAFHKENVPDKTSLSVSELNSYLLMVSPYIVPSALAQIQRDIEDNCNPDVYIHYCDSFEGVITLAKSGLGAAVLPDIPLTRENDLVYIPIENLDLLSFGIYTKTVKKSPEITGLIRILRKFLRVSDV